MLKKILVAVVIILGAYFVLYFWPTASNENIIWGVSFDSGYARYLGLNEKELFGKILDEWGFRHMRLSAHWDAVEPKPAKFDFKELDYFMNEVAARGAKVILAVGQKTPRWPECHAPGWTKEMADEEYLAALDNYLEIVVKRYATHPALEMYQVENEPFFPFGEKCRKMTDSQLAEEVKIARASGRPVIVTDSGELSTWRRTASVGDWFGTTLYRVVWNKFIGYWNYDWLPPSFYRLKFFLAGRDVNTAMVSELQAEPWSPGADVRTVSLQEQGKSMNLDRLKKHLDYASRLGVNRAYLWGAEWWAWLETKGEKSISEYIKKLDKNNPVFSPAP